VIVEENRLASYHGGEPSIAIDGDGGGKKKKEWTKSGFLATGITRDRTGGGPRKNGMNGAPIETVKKVGRSQATREKENSGQGGCWWPQLKKGGKSGKKRMSKGPSDIRAKANWKKRWLPFVAPNRK